MRFDLNSTMPNITPAQIVAVVGAFVAFLVAFGVPISDSQRDAMVSLATVLFPVLIGADALIRHGRSRALVAEPPAVRDDTPPQTVGIPDGDDAIVGALR